MQLFARSLWKKSTNTSQNFRPLLKLMLSPEQIRKRALNRYEDFLRSLTCREAIFPLALFGSGMSRVADYAMARDAIAELREHSKEIKGFGYSVEWKQQSFRRYGEQQIPAGAAVVGAQIPVIHVGVAIADQGYLPWTAIEGAYDYRTTQAVMAFQGWNGLTRTGQADRKQ